MATFWRAFLGAAFGKLFVNLLIAACITLGFGGPNEWVEFLISGMPTYVTPGVARLGLLLIASLGIFLEWRLPVQSAINVWSAPARRFGLIAFAIVCCLPFVAGAFYVTANSTPIKLDRHLKENQKEALSKEIKKIPSDQLHSIIVASVDDPEAMAYAIEFIYFFKYYAIPINEIYADPPDNRILLPQSVKEFGRLTGISLSVHDAERPPESAKVFRQAMHDAGFSVDYETFYGRLPEVGDTTKMPADFMLTIRYN